jgi:predicted metal-dependent hydrolase
MKYQYVFVIIICIAIFYKYMEASAYEVEYIKANKSGKEYLVRNIEDKQQAADNLDEMNTRFMELINYSKEHDNFELFKKFVIKKPQLESIDKLTTEQAKLLNQFNKDIKRLQKNYNPNSLSENVPNSSYTSYSENKGQKIVFCLRSKRNDKLVDINTMMFVGLHELAHLMTHSIGHKPEFWDNFRILLRIAIRIGIYDCINYNIESKDYCGTKITDSPLKCGDV